MVDHITDHENRIQVMLMQALVGIISDNFRMVTLKIAESVCEINVVLSKHDDEDEEEIVDLADELSILSNLRCHSKFVVSDDPIDLPSPPIRVIFRRKE